jgi:predicted ArsR family transcriptional regulator
MPVMKVESSTGEGGVPEGKGAVAEEDRHRVLQRQARALGDPSRYRIFRYVAEALQPVGVAAITAHVGLNHNGTRQHLAKLCDAGLLIEEFAAPVGPGRPALQYRLAPEASRFHPV